MNAPTNIQILKDNRGNPAYAVIPYHDYLAMIGDDDELIPNEVVGFMVAGATAIEAWRKYLNKTQEEVAALLGISQSAYAQQEKAVKPRKVTCENIALALGIKPSLLDI